MARTAGPQTHCNTPVERKNSSRIVVIEKNTMQALERELVGYAPTHTVIDTYSYNFDNQTFYVATLSSNQPSYSVYLLVN